MKKIKYGKLSKTARELLDYLHNRSIKPENIATNREHRVLDTLLRNGLVMWDRNNLCYKITPEGRSVDGFSFRVE